MSSQAAKGGGKMRCIRNDCLGTEKLSPEELHGGHTEDLQDTVNAVIRRE